MFRFAQHDTLLRLIKELQSSILYLRFLAELILRVVQQRHVACALDVLGDDALMAGAVAGVAARQNLAAITDEAPQLRGALVINR